MIVLFLPCTPTINKIYLHNNQKKKQIRISWHVCHDTTKQTVSDQCHLYLLDTLNILNKEITVSRSAIFSFFLEYFLDALDRSA